MREEYIERALWLARSADGEVPVAALVIDPDGVVIAEAKNACAAFDDALKHAELLALELALRVRHHSLSGCTLLVTLEPCLMCFGAALHAGISQIVFLARNEQEGALTYFHCDTQKNQILVNFKERPEAAKLLTDFFAKRRKEQQ